jgi:alkylation response protein AidB-like acyl-CoA dehydrogenase
VRASARPGKPIVDKQGISFKLADMAMEIEAARLLVWRACDAGRPRTGRRSPLAHAKAFAADAAMRAATEAVRSSAGRGSWATTVEKWFRDASLQVVEGTSEIQRLIVAGYLKRGLRGAFADRATAWREGDMAL